MIFNLKYLILPLSIIGCINNNYVNATNENQNKVMEDNTRFQNKMSVNEMGQVMRSVINHEQLNNVQTNFIQRLAYAVSSELPQDIKQWGQNIFEFFHDSWTFLGEVEDVNEEFFNNLTILSYISQYDIHRCTNAVENEIGKIENHNCSTESGLRCRLGDCNKCNQNYVYFLNQVKECYKQNYINKTQYITLLKFLLYYNTNRLFKIIIDNNKYDETVLNNLKGQGTINLSTSPHPILDCMTPYINKGKHGYHYCDSVENIIQPITKIMEELIEILLQSEITLVDINKLKETIKANVLELMAQGIYDATRNFGRLQETKQEYAKIFDINSEEFLKK